MADNGKSDKLTGKEQRFVDYYDGDQTKAARLAGYKNPDRRGYELLKRPKVAEAIRAREENERRPHIADRQRRQEFWTEVMEDKEQKMQDRLKASEYLAKSEADFVERRDLSSSDGSMSPPSRIEIVPVDQNGTESSS